MNGDGWTGGLRVDSTRQSTRATRVDRTLGVHQRHASCQTTRATDANESTRQASASPHRHPEPGQPSPAWRSELEPRPGGRAGQGRAWAPASARLPVSRRGFGLRALVYETLHVALSSAKGAQGQRVSHPSGSAGQGVR